MQKKTSQDKVRSVHSAQNFVGTRLQFDLIDGPHHDQMDISNVFHIYGGVEGSCVADESGCGSRWLSPDCNLILWGSQ